MLEHILGATGHDPWANVLSPQELAVFLDRKLQDRPAVEPVILLGEIHLVVERPLRVVIHRIEVAPRQVAQVCCDAQSLSVALRIGIVLPDEAVVDVTAGGDSAMSIAPDDEECAQGITHGDPECVGQTEQEVIDLFVAGRFDQFHRRHTWESAVYLFGPGHLFTNLPHSASRRTCETRRSGGNIACGRGERSPRASHPPPHKVSLSLTRLNTGAITIAMITGTAAITAKVTSAEPVLWNM